MPKRREFLIAVAALAAARAVARPPKRRVGHLVAIGGAEDRREDMQVLRRFVELCGAPSPAIAVMTAASGVPDLSWTSCERAFMALGAGHCVPLDMRTREEADDPRAVETILSVDGIFLTGGDQRRLMAVTGGSATQRALQQAYRERGACIGGTSAGAAALSLHMLAEGRNPALPEKDAARLDQGLALLPGAIIDQHFSERRRLGRLLSALAQRPQALGIGIDEDTALVVEQGRGIEVVGRGVVTLLDGRGMGSNVAQAAASERLEMLGVRMHLLPAGNRYAVEADGRDTRDVPASLRRAVSLLAAAPETAD
ncbi:cyanophycinase [Caldimonas tepidiphila]|uniref:cyanophycinase n=1 Tax=Caldimonas tepidiphila TaxID=2315841 RepID=UPI000E5B92DD|nr:cyanophycinase [Caldimonas tepidiphila]